MSVLVLEVVLSILLGVLFKGLAPMKIRVVYCIVMDPSLSERRNKIGMMTAVIVTDPVITMTMEVNGLFLHLPQG